MGSRPEPNADDSSLPARIERAIGPHAARRLVAALGGTEIHLGPHPRPGSRVTDVIGVEDAVKLYREIGPGDVLIPMGARASADQRRAEAVSLARDGLSTSRIATKLGVHVRTVCRWVKP